MGKERREMDGRVRCYSALVSSFSGSGSASGVFSTCMVTETDQSQVRGDHLHQSEMCVVSRSVFGNSAIIKLPFQSINHFLLRSSGSKAQKRSIDLSLLRSRLRGWKVVGQNWRHLWRMTFPTKKRGTFTASCLAFEYSRTFVSQSRKQFQL